MLLFGLKKLAFLIGSNQDSLTSLSKGSYKIFILSFNGSNFFFMVSELKGNMFRMNTLNF